MNRILPILFNTEMVRAILDGRKTVTRRICKDGNDYVVPDMSFYDADKRTYAVHNYADKEHKDKLSIVECTCPICPGNILYVRETWGRLSIKRNVGYTSERYVYKASDQYPFGEKYIVKFRWRPSVHMPKEAARIWLKVTDVRVERLQEMTQLDFMNEGVNTCQRCNCKDLCLGLSNARICYLKSDFIKTWNSTLKKSDLDSCGWDANPWVWVIEFEQCGKPEGEI